MISINRDNDHLIKNPTKKEAHTKNPPIFFVVHILYFSLFFFLAMILQINLSLKFIIWFRVQHIDMSSTNYGSVSYNFQENLWYKENIICIKVLESRRHMPPWKATVSQLWACRFRRNHFIYSCEHDLVIPFHYVLASCAYILCNEAMIKIQINFIFSKQSFIWNCLSLSLMWIQLMIEIIDQFVL